MDARNFELACEIVDRRYVEQAQDSFHSEARQVRSLLVNRCLPESGWNIQSINKFLVEVASMDSNHFPNNIGLGEREARVYSSLVMTRASGFSHGVGRSGDISAAQPKAAGASLISNLACFLVRHALRLAGFTNAHHVKILPVATGMALSLLFCTLRHTRPSASKIIFLRIDQKSCVKSILFSGFTPVLISSQTQAFMQKSRDNRIDSSLNNDQLETDLDQLESTLETIDCDEVLCVVSCTSCFAPRAPDDAVKIGRLCKQYDVPHVVNHAYGVQTRKATQLVNLACTKSSFSRVDAVVCSTDKNFLVPVGGSVIIAPKESALVNQAVQNYPGRASAVVVTDILITLLELGKDGWLKLFEEREANFLLLKSGFREIAAVYGERLLETPLNDVSLAITLNQWGEQKLAKEIGSALWKRMVSGTRVVVPRIGCEIQCGIDFEGGFGCHTDQYHSCYLTAAASFGIQKHEITQFLSRLDGILSSLRFQLTELDAHPHKAQNQL